MNKDFYIEWGLFLPFRFYRGNRNKISENSDYGKRLNIPLSEFLIMPEGVILPFQIIRTSILEYEPEIKFYCLDTEAEIDVTGDFPFVLDNFVLRTIGAYDYITFLGANPSDGEIDIPKGGYYAKFTDGFSEWYSENIKILGADEFEYIDSFRKWSDNDDDLRTTGEDLRII